MGMSRNKQNYKRLEHSGLRDLFCQECTFPRGRAKEPPNMDIENRTRLYAKLWHSIIYIYIYNHNVCIKNI